MCVYKMVIFGCLFVFLVFFFYWMVCAYVYVYDF